MYKIYCDQKLIYDSTLDDYIIGKGQISKELNKSGSFTFSMYSNNPFYNLIQKMKSVIEVTKGNELIFRGRVITESVGFNKEKTFTCEGELGYLLDSVQRPYSFNGTPAELFTQFIESHNNQVDAFKRFIVGNVTVTDPNDYIVRSNTNYEKTFTEMKNKLLDTLGGYIFIESNNNGDRVIHWYADSPYRSGQKIEFGENLLDFVKTNESSQIITALIPLGADITDEETGIKSKLTIADVNDGLDYIYNQDAVNLYGWIVDSYTWNDVTVTSNLKKKGEDYLSSQIKQNINIELSAIDLSLMDKNIDSFRLGDHIDIVSNPHNLDDTYLLEKQTINLLKPETDKIKLGYSYATFTDKSLKSDYKADTLFQKVEVIESNYAINTVVNDALERLQSLINQTSTSISMLISEEYVDNGKLQSELSTLYEQLSDSFNFYFKGLEEKVDGNDQTSREEFASFKKYIRFEDGNIILGEKGNELTLKIMKDKISFYQGTSEVAYFSNAKMYVKDGEFLKSLTVGKFAFIPRDNDNLSFKKVG